MLCNNCEFNYTIELIKNMIEKYEKVVRILENQVKQKDKIIKLYEKKAALIEKLPVHGKC